jgi:hypothetical protein
MNCPANRQSNTVKFSIVKFKGDVCPPNYKDGSSNTNSSLCVPKDNSVTACPSGKSIKEATNKCKADYNLCI